jgi:HAD superfamily hydrolase (TIGR01509 family)
MSATQNQTKPAFDAVIFDLDGVITQTALVHSAAWKKMFDDFLITWYARKGEPCKLFTHKDDYLPFVDGKPRYKGVSDFLASRGIELPFGDPSDSTDLETVCGLGNRKNDAFNEVLERDGVEVYPSTIALMHELIALGVHVGVASSSKNCEGVLRKAGLLHLIETRVDGVVSAELGLKGKPEADIFTRAAANMGCHPERSIVVEDAVSGVQAGRTGNFGLVLGIAREHNAAELIEGGADMVVEDLSETSIIELNQWFVKGIEDDQWSVTYYDYNTKKERSREALLTTGNGYFGSRGAFEETVANPVNYPGTYMAGMYNRLITPISGRDIENEDFVNLPNWLPVTFKIDEDGWFDINRTNILIIKRSLDFRNGMLNRELIAEDNKGRQTLIRVKRFVSMHNPMLGAISYSISPINYEGTITVKSSVDGNVINAGVERYKSLNSSHLEVLKEGSERNLIFVLASTTQSKHQIAVAAGHRLLLDGQVQQQHPEILEIKGQVSAQFSLHLSAGQDFLIEKIAGICSDKDDFADDALSAALRTAEASSGFDMLLAENSKAWDDIWQKTDIAVTGDRRSQKLLRLHLYHLLVSMSPFNKQLDASITARGLHGEAYRGHIFWDELFILPLYDLQMPDVARSMLLYRYHRLQKAREYATAHGYKGAMFPWQSGSDGREETQVVHLNPLTGEWGDDHSSLQRHVSLAIAYNVWDYYWITGDLEFLRKFGAEMFFEICRFWRSKAQFDEQNGRYSISGVMGPDEFHEHYPGSESGGLTDNAYTNIMVAWMFGKAKTIAGLTGNDCLKKAGFSLAEIDEWLEVAAKLRLVVSEEGIIAQYDGYFELKELDWDYYRSKYGNIYRMDRILKAEGKSPDEYKVAKQADTLMAFYNLNKEEVDAIIGNMGYNLPDDYLQRNLAYYLARTSHGSTLSRVVHARLAALAGDRELSMKLYQDALGSDYNDIQGGTTGEGIHAGVMAGTLLIALNTFAGINYREELLHLDPNIPENWNEMKFGITFKNVRYNFILTRSSVQLTTSAGVRLVVKGKEFHTTALEPLSIKL